MILRQHQAKSRSQSLLLSNIVMIISPCCYLRFAKTPVIANPTNHKPQNNGSFSSSSILQSLSLLSSTDDFPQRSARFGLPSFPLPSPSRIEFWPVGCDMQRINKRARMLACLLSCMRVAMCMQADGFFLPTRDVLLEA